MTGDADPVVKAPQKEAFDASILAESYTMSLLRTDDEVAASADDLRRFLESADAITPNNTPARYLSTARALGHQPLVAIARRDGVIVGLVMAREAHRRERFRIGYSTLSSPTLRTLDVVYGGFQASDAHAADVLLKHLVTITRQRQCDLLTFNHIAAHRPEAQILAKALRPVCSAIKSETDPHIEYEIADGGYKTNLSHLSSKHRYNLRRERRLLAERFEGDLTLRVFRHLEDVDELALGTHELAVQTWQARSRGNFLDTPLNRVLLENDAKAGSLRSYWLLGAGRLIAFQIGGVYGRRYVLHSIGHDAQYERLSPGKTLFQMALDDLCQSEAKFIDYGFGEAAYKKQFATRCWDEQRLRFYAKSWKGRYVGAMDGLVDSASKAGGSILQRLGKLNTVKKKWRARLSVKQ